MLHLPIGNIIVPDAKNARLEQDPDRVHALAKSLRQIGLTNPITVRPTSKGHELIAGSYRLAAALQLGWSTIPAIVQHDDDQTAAHRRLAENVTRSNMTPVEEALAIAPLVEQYPDGTIGLAEALGRSQAWIEDRLQILDWPTSLIEHVHARRIKLGAAKHLASIPYPDAREAYIRDAAQNGITTRTAAMWKQQAIALATGNFEASETLVGPPEIQSQTDVTVRCFACQDFKPLAQTTATRICTDCVSLLHAAQQSHDEHPPQHHHAPHATIPTHAQATLTT